MLELKLITKDNLEYAIRTQNEIFPEYNGKNNYLDSIKNGKQSQFFFIMEKETCIGITGIYSYKNDRDNAWLGFFGIKQLYRDKGYGRKALAMTEEYASSIGFKFMRLFTDKENNDLAINFYTKAGYTFEDYDNDQEALKDQFNVVICSKSLCDEKVDLWNNRFINLTKQTYKQQYNEIETINDDTDSIEDTQVTEYYVEEKLTGKTKKNHSISMKG